MNSHTVSKNTEYLTEIFTDPAIEEEHQRRLKYYKLELAAPTREIPLEKRHKSNSRLSEWFSFGGGI